MSVAKVAIWVVSGLLLVIFTVAAVRLDVYLTQDVLLPVFEGGDIPNSQHQAIEIIVARVSLISNWNMATAGVALYCFINSCNRSSEFFFYAPLSTGFCLSICSLFLAQTILDILVRGLTLESNVLQNVYLSNALRLQYALTISSVIFILLSGLRMRLK